jgi:hypothetical protein
VRLQQSPFSAHRRRFSTDLQPVSPDIRVVSNERLAKPTSLRGWTAENCRHKVQAGKVVDFETAAPTDRTRKLEGMAWAMRACQRPSFL